MKTFCLNPFPCRAILAGLAIFLSAGLQAQPITEAERPNIVLFMVDDMGFSDPGFAGGEVRTPALDRLADEGMIFTHFTNNGKCLPTRQALFLGNYARNLDNSENTELSYALKAAGYGSYMVGKVHGHTRLGWDRSVTMFAADDHWEPKNIWVNGLKDPDFLDSHPDYYSSDTFTDYGLQYIEEHLAERPEDPFFLYLAYSAPHDPLHAPTETVEKYEGVYEKGWDTIREERYQRILEKNFFGRPVEMAPRDPDVPLWNSLSKEKQQAEAARMRVHAAMVDRVDQNIARVYRLLEEKDLLENTLIVFLSDNGATRADWVEPSPDFIGDGSVEGSVALGIGWASASNAPLREYKSSNFEGGGRTTALAYWKGTIQPGSVDHDFAHVTDLTATFLDLAGLPHDRILGKTLRPAFHGRERDLHTDEGIGFGFKQAHAWREGKWKLVRYKGPWHLFDMEADPTEVHNLVDEYPEIVERLESKWIEWNKGVVYRGQAEDLKGEDARGGQEPTLIELNL
jgi:arylsulfatase